MKIFVNCNIQKECKVCVAEYARDMYKKHGRANQRIKRELKGVSECERMEALEFDHLAKTQKDITIGKEQSSKKITEEAQKCRVLCIWCYMQFENMIKKMLYSAE
jgi:hypothetical protein